MSGIEGVGEAVTGGMIARAVEPKAGDAQGRSDACLNCGTGLIGSYCHRCGQAGHVYRTLTAWWHDLAHGALHLDGKLWRTLPLLAWRPGELTRRYIEGERARFVSPMAMFLFSVFLMFAVFSAVGTRAYQDRRSPETIAQARAEAEKDAAGIAGAAAEDNPAILAGEGSVNEWVNATYRKAKQNPSLLAYKLQSNGYKFSWALIPISVPFVWLLFLQRSRYRQYRTYDHTVFVTYSIAFMSLAAVAITLMKLLGLIGTWALLPLLVPPIHMYRQLRGAYRLSRLSALWRTIALLTFAFIAGGLFFLMLLMIGVLN